MSANERLMAKAKNPSTLLPDGNYTNPRSFGVNRLTERGNVRRRYRFGNHPVRMNELIRDFGDCKIEALFLDRKDAEELARLLKG